ncbi:ParB/RepB/Spo0J family partition protein [Flagellimonas nanhaiensis]|uniref:ParB/RepB/Spo0J family partition protein n=1 Tax=Flagellimonas nanhaiensis TaxID=2292706 RepID=A0A371JLP3_9FLAO|nr:ParB/RepB/Spo0J family partition protein [Allomuricauda nanhaiensis]RDY57931.1 ParB/RepB/Spo0J family partition protein [Allomuricauda nanhaiensis]
METQTKARLQTLPLQEIAIGTSNPRKVFDSEALKELTQSIHEKGILQPLLVRPHDGGFQLVCGERRLRAATLAKLSEVPVQVQELTDEEVLEVQLIENLEREDVHPLQEAETLQRMLDTEKYTVSDLASKLAKSETFVIQRLSLNGLIKAWKDAFLKDHINLGKALIVARLTKAGQKELAENAMDHVGGIKSKAALERFIDRQISRKLEQAPFDVCNEALVKKAGPCTTCNKRSGANERLFPDIEADDQCFDKACYELKVQAHLMKRAKEIVNGAEPVHFIYSPYAEELPNGLVKLLEKHNIKLLEQYEDFELHGNDDQAKEGLWLNGSGKGHPEKIYLPKRSKGKMQELPPKERIARIEQRAERALELDAEKVQKRIIESLAETEELHELGKLPIQPVDTLLQRLWLWNTAPWEVQETLGKTFKWSSGVSNKTMLQRLERMTEAQVAHLVRLTVFAKWRHSLPTFIEGMALRSLAEGIPSVPIADIEKEQRQVARKRIKRTKERIEKLKEQC